MSAPIQAAWFMWAFHFHRGTREITSVVRYRDRLRVDLGVLIDPPQLVGTVGDGQPDWDPDGASGRAPATVRGMRARERHLKASASGRPRRFLHFAEVASESSATCDEVIVLHRVSLLHRG